jgi:hypothetical protein
MMNFDLSATLKSWCSVDSSIAIGSVVKHKLAKGTQIDTELLQGFANNFSNPLDSVSAC